MKRAKLISIMAAGLLVLGGMLMLAGCSGSSSQSADGKEAVVSLSVGADDTWKSAVDPADVVSVSEPTKVGSDKVEFTVKPLKDGSAEVTFTNMKGDAETGTSQSFTYECKDGKITQTGTSGHIGGSF